MEFSALKWAITEKIHDYLYGIPFTVYTDNNPLTYIHTTAKLNSCGQRWVAALANYDFKIYYRSGKSNIEADALSRIQREISTSSSEPELKSKEKSKDYFGLEWIQTLKPGLKNVADA